MSRLISFTDEFKSEYGIDGFMIRDNIYGYIMELELFARQLLGGNKALALRQIEIHPTYCNDFTLSNYGLSIEERNRYLKYFLKLRSQDDVFSAIALENDADKLKHFLESNYCEEIYIVQDRDIFIDEVLSSFQTFKKASDPKVLIKSFPEHLEYTLRDTGKVISDFSNYIDSDSFKTKFTDEADYWELIGEINKLNFSLDEMFFVVETISERANELSEKKDPFVNSIEQVSSLPFIMCSYLRAEYLVDFLCSLGSITPTEKISKEELKQNYNDKLYEISELYRNKDLFIEKMNDAEIKIPLELITDTKTFDGRISDFIESIAALVMMI